MLNEIASIVWKNEMADQVEDMSKGPVGLTRPDGSIDWLTTDEDDRVWLHKYQAEALARAAGCLFREV